VYTKTYDGTNIRSYSVISTAVTATKAATTRATPTTAQGYIGRDWVKGDMSDGSLKMYYLIVSDGVFSTAFMDKLVNIYTSSGSSPFSLPCPTGRYSASNAIPAMKYCVDCPAGKWS